MNHPRTRKNSLQCQSGVSRVRIDGPPGPPRGIADLTRDWDILGGSHVCLYAGVCILKHAHAQALAGAPPLPPFVRVSTHTSWSGIIRFDTARVVYDSILVHIRCRFIFLGVGAELFQQSATLYFYNVFFQVVCVFGGCVKK